MSPSSTISLPSRQKLLDRTRDRQSSDVGGGFRLPARPAGLAGPAGPQGAWRSPRDAVRTAVDFADGGVSPSHTSTRYAVLYSPGAVDFVSFPRQGANPVRGTHRIMGATARTSNDLPAGKATA